MKLICQYNAGNNRPNLYKQGFRFVIPSHPFRKIPSRIPLSSMSGHAEKPNPLLIYHFFTMLKEPDSSGPGKTVTLPIFFETRLLFFGTLTYNTVSFFFAFIFRQYRCTARFHYDVVFINRAHDIIVNKTVNKNHH